ncbi:hypothetical protein VHEMI05407 [[Torrubiella] hemipterigena]|nr:hypothetical protein VHEMI05407 [[Torrubiella] hemipterigena]
MIESRLGSIETLLHGLSHPFGGSRETTAVEISSSRAEHTPQTGSSSAPTCESGIDGDSGGEEEASFGGDQGLTAHTAFASEFLERAVKRTSLRSPNPKMEAALANLGQLVSMQKKSTSGFKAKFVQRPIPPGGVTKLSLPPMSTVVELLKKDKAVPLSLFSIMCSLTGITDVANICRTVYFPTEDVSESIFVIVNALLYNLFLEHCSHTTDAAVREEYLAHFHLCRANLETALANLPMLLSPKVENAQALLFGCLYSVDVSRPTAAWHFASAGAQLCITGGFHRAEALKDNPPHIARIKRIIFWHIYTVDKSLGLRLGRASSIQECDISIAREFEFDDFGPAGADSVPTMWVEVSGLQGRIYELLYSPAALACPPATLATRARALAEDILRLEDRAAMSRKRAYEYMEKKNCSDMVDLFIRGDEVQFYVTLTLAYRVIPSPEGSPSRFSEECLDAARMAIRAHHDCVSKIDLTSFTKATYVHWNLLVTPFAPFFVLFCYVIETLSAEDMLMLKEFAASLALTRDSSEAMEKLYRLCQVMYDVLAIYVETKTQHPQDQGFVPMGDEFEMYMGQLGLIPMEDHTMGNAGGANTAAGQQDVAASVQNSSQVAQIADWFSGNRNMVGLLEADLSNIESYRWMQQGNGM